MTPRVPDEPGVAHFNRGYGRTFGVVLVFTSAVLLLGIFLVVTQRIGAGMVVIGLGLVIALATGISRFMTPAFFIDTNRGVIGTSRQQWKFAEITHFCIVKTPRQGPNVALLMERKALTFSIKSSKFEAPSIADWRALLVAVEGSSIEDAPAQPQHPGLRARYGFASVSYGEAVRRIRAEIAYLAEPAFRARAFEPFADERLSDAWQHRDH